MNIFTLPTTEQTRSYFVALNYVPLWYSGEAVGLCTTMEPGSKPSSGKKFLPELKFFLIKTLLFRIFIYKGWTSPAQPGVISLL